MHVKKAWNSAIYRTFALGVAFSPPVYADFNEGGKSTSENIVGLKSIIEEAIEQKTCWVGSWLILPAIVLS